MTNRERLESMEESMRTIIQSTNLGMSRLERMMLSKFGHRFPEYQRWFFRGSVSLSRPPISVSEGTEMNGTSQNVNNRNFGKKSYPGCLGRMVNLFELNIGVSPNRLLTDKPHRDGSPISKSRSDVSRLSLSPDPVVDEGIEHGLRSYSPNRKSNGMPIKMLIDHEMSKEVDSRRSPPNLVAKLMGLDALPHPELEPATNRSPSKGNPRSHSEIPVRNWQRQQRFSHYGESNEYKDIYEIWEQPQRHTMENDKKMTLVRRKFLEAKSLSMDGRLRQSKQFQDALEVLSSNRDLFLKCLEEPGQVFSQQLYGLHSIPPPPETKRITVLRPSKIADTFNLAGDREGKRELDKGDFPHPRNSPPKNHESPTQPTRIVVLKPSLEKILDNSKANISPRSQSARIHGEGFLGDVEDNENWESRKVAKAIASQMREKFGSRHRDESITCMAEESSFGKSEIEYPAGDLSDSEVTSPMSRHSWDCVHNRPGSPFSSSFSRASYSPESSVCREAKKRLSERWALMASNRSCQEQRQIRRSSSTLGEMLALSETEHKKNDIAPVKESAFDEKLKDSSNLLENGERIVEDVDDNSPRNLTRSKSVPVSSSQFGTRLYAETTVVLNKAKLEVVPKGDAKARSRKSSFKGKVSSLFFSRNKKGSKDKPIEPETKDDSSSSFLGDISSGGSESLVEKVPKHSPSGLLELSSKASSSGVISPEPQFYVSKSAASGNLCENQEQPSPVSVLDPPFELNERTSTVFPHYVEPDQHGYESLLSPLSSSNLIDKSPLIGSVARTLSWEDSSLDTASSYPQTTKDEGQEWYSFVRTLLSVAGLEGVAQTDSESFFARWHSPESPLDPSLRDTYIELKNDRKMMHEAKRRQKRSMQKLVFDCVNAILVELAGSRLGPDEVWARMEAWFSGGCISVECGEENGVVLETVVRNEVAGKGWVDNLMLERDILGKDIERVLLEELLEEAVVELDR
ncbi:Protein of unknown function (DUF3741 [Striga hermonthica]|uniref:DUF4378 domain-containing protein n=1 Tax=Striga hermonthica TaxID=68872 RepID=A0A9N7R7G6_STRHE|nr:Protein of unknown function (DUF3741 [Striga hermonthica]